jgi:hypothetical protein
MREHDIEAICEYASAVTLGRRVMVAMAILLLARPCGTPGDGSVASLGKGSPPTSPTAAQMEELAEKLAERREKLDYFYITAFTAILVFTFNNFNLPAGVLVKAPVWLVEVGWASLIVAALCPMHVISARFQALRHEYGLAGRQAFRPEAI